MGNDFDIADKITVENFKQKKTGKHDSSIESKPEIKAPAPNEVYFEEQVKEKLSKIIDEINLRYNKNFDFDVATKSVLQVRDLLLKIKDLKTVQIVILLVTLDLHIMMLFKMHLWKVMNKIWIYFLCY